MANTWTAGSGSAFTLNPLTHRPHGLTHSGVPYDSPCSSSRSSPRQRHQGSPQQQQQQGSPLSDGRSSSSMQKESDRAIALQLQREEELALESAAALDASGSGGASVAPAARQRTDSEFARQLHEEEKRMLASEQQGQGHQGFPGVLGRMSAPGQSTGQGASPFSHPFQQQGPGQVQGGGASKVAKPGKAGKEKGGMFGMRMPDLHLRDKGLMFPSAKTAASKSYKLVCARLVRAPSSDLRPSVNRFNPSLLDSLNPGSSFFKDVVSPDRDRLLLRLDQYDLTERKVEGDGACQFRSLSDQLYGSQEHHAQVREAVVQQLQLQPERYSMYVPGEYKQYCAEMAKSSTWGDHVTLQAAADVFGLRINVLTSFKEECVIKIEPAKASSSRVLWLSFWAEVHYNSIYPKEEPPVE